MTTQLPPAGWYPDPNGGPGQVYWDGQRWHTEIPATPPPVQSGIPSPAGGQRPRRGPMLALIAVIVVVVAAAAGITSYLLSQHSHASQIPTAQPVSEAALEGLLLSSDQINIAMGATGMTVAKTFTAMVDDSADVSDKACLPADSAAEAAVYAGSGSSAVRGQGVADQPAHIVDQFVVLFPSAQDAHAFYTASTQSWPACANRQFTDHSEVLTVGPVSTTNGILSAPQTIAQTIAGRIVWTGQRALTVANNVVIDVAAGAAGQSGYRPDSAVTIARQIAAKVPTR
jgi:hypothetical protein